LRKLAAPRLQALVDLYGLTANLAVLEGLDVLYFAKRESPDALRFTVAVGHRVPVHGKRFRR